MTYQIRPWRIHGQQSARRSSLLTCLFLLVSIILVPAAATATIPTGLTTDLTLTHDGEVRTYDVLRPFSSLGTPRPLVVDLHGASSDGNQQRGISGWDAIADAEGLVVAWPDGIANVWNGGTCCGSAVTNNVDDVGFIRAMVEAIDSEINIDSGRIYVTGLSNGGAMTQRLACEAADLFAAAAPMAFPVPYVDFSAQCLPSESIPVLSFMGLTDSVVSYAGAAPSFAGWRDKLACDSAGPAPEVSETYGGSDCVIDTSCGDPGVETGLCSVTGSDLDPPLEIFNGHLLYINDDAFNLSQRAWDFMSPHRTSALAVPMPIVPMALGGILAAIGGIGAGYARHRRK